MLKATGISKRFDDRKVLDDLSFTLENEKTLSILGKSGCGKTTLLKIIAGLLPDASGEIFLDDQSLGNTPAHRRNIVYIYQEPLLFPHLDVFENIAFGLRVRKMAHSVVKEKTTEMISNLQLSEHAHKSPGQLSGGQRQRVAFGRALIIQPKLLLLDEPFGNLDKETRESMQQFFREVESRFRITSIFVTHDLKEALSVGDEFALMEAGKLISFKDVDAFIRDPRTGVSGEMEFWKKYL